jgi:hypothetical protein
VFVQPVATLRAITSGFGSRINPVTGQYQKLHNGLDLAAPEGTPVLAARAGTVTVVATGHAVNGNWVKIKHDGSYETAYLHLSRIDVRKGQQVSAGQVIGAVGKTGRATGPHLHFIAYKAGNPVDPKPLIAWGIVRGVAKTALTMWLWSGVAAAVLITGFVLMRRVRRNPGLDSKFEQAYEDLQAYAPDKSILRLRADELVERVERRGRGASPMDVRHMEEMLRLAEQHYVRQRA